MNILRFLFLLLAMSVATGAWSSQHPRVAMETSMGTIEIELYPDKAPATVENFLGYVRDGFYDGTIFHRVIKRFMIQGGGYDASMNKKPTRDPIRNEADNGLRNERGTIAMARTNVPDSATSQFFINHKDNAPLDHTGKTERGWGYAVFGKVTRGMDVVDAIASVKTRVIPPGIVRDVPVETVTIHKVSIISGE